MFKFLGIFCFVMILNSFAFSQTKKIVYIVSDTTIPYWQIMVKGIKNQAFNLGYELVVYNSANLKSKELTNTIKALNSNIKGLIISPINSSTGSTIVSLANKKNIPVVVADIGVNNKNYISFISSNNEKGAYNLGLILAKKMKTLNWHKKFTVGIIAIPQKRANGKARTKGFLKALDEYGIKTAGLLQQIDFSYKETYNYTKTLIEKNPELRAIWLQGSNRYQAAIDAIKASNKTKEILLVCFDSEPEFIKMIQEEKLLASAMQQPFLLGEKALKALHGHLTNKKVKKNQNLQILVVSKNNIEKLLPKIKKDVLGIQN